LGGSRCLLCGGRRTTATETDTPDIFFSIVETVLREGSDPPLHPGDQLTTADPIPGTHVFVYASARRGLFPIGEDGTGSYAVGRSGG